MTPLVGTILGPVLKDVLDSLVEKVTNNIPVSQTEKENIKLEMERDLAQHAGTIAEAEARIHESQKEQWLADLHNGGWMAQNWRPVVAVGSFFHLMWDGVLLPFVNTVFTWFGMVKLIPYSPEIIVECSFYLLLALVGARGLEKISVARMGADKRT